MNNVLSTIISEYHDIWRDSKRFRALLDDCLPNDKLTRNLLIISAEEQIPHKLSQVSEYDNRIAFCLVKTLINASGCDSVCACNIISLWLDAFCISHPEVICFTNDTNTKELNHDYSEYVESAPSVQELLLSATRHYEDEDYAGFLELFKQAVESGYYGDYSIIGIIYTSGFADIERDMFEGFYWLSRFYHDYKKKLITITDYSGVFKVCYFLGTMELWNLQNGDHSKNQLKPTTERFISLWKEAIELASFISSTDEKDTEAEMITVLGCCFYYGEVHSQDHDNYPIEVDYELAFKAFSEGYRLGNGQASALLGEMYENGLYIEQNMNAASIRFFRGAMRKNKESMEWCQKHFIDPLPWNSGVNWNRIKLQDTFEAWVANTLKGMGLKTVDDLRMSFFETIVNSAYEEIPYQMLRKIREGMIYQVLDMNLDNLDVEEEDLNILRRESIYTLGDYLNKADEMNSIDHKLKERCNKLIEQRIPEYVINSADTYPKQLYR